MADSGDDVVASAADGSEEVKGVEGAEEPAVDSASVNHDGENPSAKRKLEDIEPHEGEEAPLKKQGVSGPEDEEEAVAEVGVDAGEAAGDGGGEIDESGVDAAEVEEEVKDSEERISELKESEAAEPEGEDADAEQEDKDARIEDSGNDGGKDVDKESPSAENGQVPSVQDVQNVSVPPNESSRKIEVPNSKVGVLIGKSGDTIKFLQINSGAKIQITRDAEVDPQSSTRPVELLGTLEQINKAEKLIKDVIAEADAGGSPSLVARGFGTVQSGGDQIEIKLPNEKVGWVIGKGGETIKNLQTRSGARIQLIPQHLPEGDASKERIVRITGSKKQIETAKEMIKEAMNQTHPRPSPLSGGYNQHGFRPRGPAPMPQWESRPAGPAQPSMGYNYQQRGTYPPPQTTQYHQSYGGYSQQPPRGGFSSGWDQRSGAPVQGTPPSSGYDYYGHGAHANQNQPMPNPANVSTPGPVNYNYGQSQPPNYGHPTAYSQPTHGYGPGYNDNQAPGQHYYGQQQPTGTQPGSYGQQAGVPQTGYGQQQSYNKAGYGMPPEVPPAYGPPRAAHPGDPMYQGSAPSSYPNQQPYPYGSSAPSQPVPAYNQTYGQTTLGYGQGQPAPAYTQPSSQPGAYGQYPSTQQSYADPATGNANYPYHGATTDAGYGGAPPTAGYGAAPQPASQPGYAQPTANPSGYYDQSVPPQAGYASQQPPVAPATYNKSVSPQPATYTGQYDATQMYGHH